MLLRLVQQLVQQYLPKFVWQFLYICSGDYALTKILEGTLVVIPVGGCTQFVCVFSLMHCFYKDFHLLWYLYDAHII